MWAVQEPTRCASREVRIRLQDVELNGELTLPRNASGCVLLANGGGSSRFSPRNTDVARSLRDAGLGTLLFDLLTPEEQSLDSFRTQCDVHLLSDRLVGSTRWLTETLEKLAPQSRCAQRLGYFSANRAGGAALLAAARIGSSVRAIVSRGGRPDLAEEVLANVTCPSLFIVAEKDRAVLEMNRWAYAQMGCRKDLRVIAGATHAFDEAHAHGEVSRLSTGWFHRHLGRRDPRSSERKRAIIHGLEDTARPNV